LSHHGPFEAAQLAAEFGLGVAVVTRELDAMARQGKVTIGRLRPVEAGGSDGREYCSTEILSRARRRSLATLRRQVEPVPSQVLGRFALTWHRLGKLKGVDGTLQAVNGLAGAALPASALESVVLPSRVVDYQPPMLDELITAGEVAWIGQGKTTGSDGLIRLVATSTDDSVLADCEPVESDLPLKLLEVLSCGGAFLAEELLAKMVPLDAAAMAAGAVVDLTDLRHALWELVWAGWVSGDSFAPVRAFLARGKTAHRTIRRPRSRTLMGRVSLAPRPSGLAAGPAGSGNRTGFGRLLDQRVSGRWSLAPSPAAQSLSLAPEQLLATMAASLLERHGVLTKGAAPPDSSFAKLYPVLTAMEQAGSIRRGYFVEQLGGSQFALPPCPDMLRAAAETNSTVMLAAADPANPYGAALPWPEPPAGHRPGRGAGALVVLVNGDLAIYLERGGKTALTFVTGQPLEVAGRTLAAEAKKGQLGTLKVARLNGQDALEAYGQQNAAALALVQAGFGVTPSGLTLRADNARR